MTWVTGTTTWGSLEHLLAQLACGEVADGSATTVVSGSRWVREVTRTVTDGVTNSTTTITSATASFVATDVGSLVIGAGITLGTTIASVTNSTTVVLSATATATATAVTMQIATNTIRTPASKDVATGSCSGRTGYFLNLGATTTPLTAGQAGQNTVCKLTGIATTNPASGNFGRWLVLVRVSAANTVSGNYSTANLIVSSFDLDVGTAYLNSGGVTPSATGTATLAATTGTIPIQVTDPSGFLTVGSVFMRAFTSTFVGGIDAWPMWYRSSTTSPTFSVAPPGVAVTDYDIVAQSYGVTVNPVVAIDRGNMLHGLGIKTSTGLGSNALYTVSHSMALAKMRMFSSSNGVLSLDVGQSKKDPVNSLSTFRLCGGMRVTTWLKCFTTPGSVSASSAVQYWMSVTADGIVVAANGDTAATGKLGAAFYCSFTPSDTTYDVFPLGFNHAVTDYTADTATDSFQTATQYPYWSLRRRQDGSESSANRDWQTKWLRGEHLLTAASPSLAGMVSAGADLSTIAEAPSGTQAQQLSALGMNSNVQGITAVGAPSRQNKPAPDGKWWLYGIQYGEGIWLAAASLALASENRFVRGSQSTRFAFIPETGWGNGDELSDSISGTKYLLLAPDYAAAGMARTRTSSNTFFGGVAIAEL